MDERTASEDVARAFVVVLHKTLLTTARGRSDSGSAAWHLCFWRRLGIVQIVQRMTKERHQHGVADHAKERLVMPSMSEVCEAKRSSMLHVM